MTFPLAALLVAAGLVGTVGAVSVAAPMLSGAPAMGMPGGHMHDGGMGGGMMGGMDGHDGCHCCQSPGPPPSQDD